jgi:hypothetical protein
VLARTGDRVRLRHIRAGGKVLTTSVWVDEFTSALAAADTAYFAAKQEAADGAPTRAPGFAAPKRPRNRRRTKSTVDPDQQRRVADELDGEGL